jgi:hypothetical protein
MALYFEDSSEGPKIHIFVIGVGGYPYLKGGVSEKEQTTGVAARLGQLTSPPVSAEAFCEMAIELHGSQSWATPLGSIDVLVSNPSEGRSVFEGHQVKAANMENIKDSYFAWKARCDTHEDNVALFLFCGHGLGKGEHYLLAEDFGKRPEDPWDGCFAFDTTVMGFGTCQAKTQIFLVDSCRQVTSDMQGLNLMIRPLEQAAFATGTSENKFVQKAAAHNESAYGKKNKESFYVSAIIKAFKGNAAEKRNGIWKVSTGTICSKMNELVDRELAGAQPRQRCDNSIIGEIPIVVLRTPPTVALKITCNPLPALTHADLNYREVNTGISDNRAAIDQPWIVNVTAGIYEVHATFPEGDFHSTPETTVVSPPFTDHVALCHL